MVKYLIGTGSDFKEFGPGRVVVIVHPKDKREMVFYVKRESIMIGGLRSFSVVGHGGRQR